MRKQGDVPLSNKKHIMKMRGSQKFYVQHAKTQRFQNSLINYMQKLLDDET